MWTRCNGCRKKIPMGNTYCDTCKTQKRKEDKSYLKCKDAERHSKTQRWKDTRKEILKRDKGVCRLCFIRGIVSSKRLTVHHIIKRVNLVGTKDEELIYAPSNLVTLCPTCHEEMEVLPVEVQKKLVHLEDEEVGKDFSL